MSSIGSGSNYVNQSLNNEQVCSEPPKEELSCSAPPEEQVCKAPEDKAKVNSIPKGKGDQPLPLFSEGKNASHVPKVPVTSVLLVEPEDMVCSEENFLSEPEAQNASPVEADVNVNMTDNKIKASGSVILRQEYIRSTFADALKKMDKVENASISFDSNNNTYKVTGKYNPDYLPKQDFTLTLKPTVENHKLGLKLDSDDYWGVFNNTIGESIAEEVSQKGVSTTYNSESKVISFDTDSILKKTDAIHYTTKTDLSKTDITFSTNNRGDITLGLSDPDVKSPLNKSVKSDVLINMDPASFKATLQKAFGEHLSIADLELKDGQATIKGKAKATDLKDGLVGLVGLWGIGTGDISALSKANQMANEEAPKIDTEIQVTLKGGQVIMKPKSSMHLGPLAEAMKKEGYKISTVDEKNQEIRFPLNELLPEGSTGNINDAKINGEGLFLDGTF